MVNSSYGFDIERPANWPDDAEFGITYKARDRQFPDVNHLWHSTFLKDEAELQKWLADKREWIQGTDNDFELKYKLYKWELGPVYVRTETLTGD
jgi:hypothetical protein